jgi:hypothetical protein
VDILTDDFPVIDIEYLLAQYIISILQTIQNKARSIRSSQLCSIRLPRYYILVRHAFAI